MSYRPMIDTNFAQLTKVRTPRRILKTEQISYKNSPQVIKTRHSR